MKTICIYHSRDLDGWMSAAIVKKWFTENNTNVITVNIDTSTKNDVYSYSKYNYKDNLLYMKGWDYGDNITNLDKYDSVIMCDVSFPKDEMYKLKDKLIWVDHHISAIKEVYGEHKWLKDKKDFEGNQDIKFAACELTWEYFFPDQDIPEIVRLLGRYDCFGHKGTEEEQKVLEFQYGARASMSNYEDCYERLQKSILDRQKQIIFPIESIIHINGMSIYRYLCTEAKHIYKKTFPIELQEKTYDDKKMVGIVFRKFLCINQERFNPINFGIDYHENGYDGFACFWMKDGKWVWSLYNDNEEVDCSQIAKSLGGGGHKGAAGFVVENINSFLETVYER